MTAPARTSTRSVTPEQAGFRADRALCALVPELNRRATKLLFHSGAVRLNGKLARGSERVEAGDQMTCPEPEAGPGDALPGKVRAPRLTTRHGRHVGRLYEDDALMVLNKPPEIPIHRGADGLTRRETLEDVLERAYPRNNDALRMTKDELNSTSDFPDDESEEETLAHPPRTPHPRADQSAIRKPQAAFYFAHRLDMETTGCLLVAKTASARDALIRDFEQRRVKKTYLAVVSGEIPWAKRVVQRPILYVRAREDGSSARDGGLRPLRSNSGADEAQGYGSSGAHRPREFAPDWAKRKKFGKLIRAVKMGVALEEGSTKGKACETAFHVEQRFKGYTLLRCEPRTGRMHQIRVHLAAEGFPLAYDRLYGRRSPLRIREFDLAAGAGEHGELVLLNRMPLHAWKIEFTHPVSGERVEVEAPIPKDLKEFLRVLRRFRSRKEGSRRG